MPDADVDVLTYHPDRGVNIDAYIFFICFESGEQTGEAGWCEFHNQSSETDVTHWMPLPEPPK